MRRDGLENMVSNMRVDYMVLSLWSFPFLHLNQKKHILDDLPIDKM
jgi:hypothetical protein